jgi:hypothetical protein
MKVAKFTKPLSVGLEPETYARIQRITDDSQISMAEWIRKAIDSALRNSIHIGGDDDEQ